jgi:hypothetical protein
MYKSDLFLDLTLTCFDGEGEGGAGSGEAGTGNTSNTGGEAKNAFTQDDVNKFLAEDRRKHQEKYKSLETRLAQLAESKNIEEKERAKYQEEVESLRAQWLTKEQQAEYNRKREKEAYEKELKNAKEAATQYQTLYTSHIIDDSIRRAASPEDVMNQEIVVQLLRPRTQIRELTDDEGKPTGKQGPMVEFDDIDENTGQPITTLRTPADALKRMKELPNQYGGLFRANIISGVGSGAATGGVSSGSGKIDMKKIASDPALYRKYRKENPSLLGLKPNR